MTDYILFDRATGVIENIVTSSPDHILFQTMGGTRGHAEIEGPFRTVAFDDGVVTQSFNLDAVRAPLLRRIDAEALAIVADPFAAIHATKAEEARGGGEMPLITAEAAATGKTPADVAKAVMDQAEAAKATAQAIELKRITAKQAVREGATILAIVNAATVDWSALIAEA
jgi:membrane-associated protease RseP (regulator of RpoE activity)